MIQRLLSLLIIGNLWAGPLAADEQTGSGSDDVAVLLDLMLDADAATAARCLGILSGRLQTGGIETSRVQALRSQLGPRLDAIVRDAAHPLRLDAALVTAAWHDAAGLEVVRAQLDEPAAPGAQRLAALQALIALNDPLVVSCVESLLTGQAAGSVELHAQFLSALGRSDRPELAATLLRLYPQLDPALRPRVIEILTQRPVWTMPLLTAVKAQQVDKGVINLNQLRRVATFKDAGVQKLLSDLYGEIREGRDPNREQVFYKTRDFLNGTPGDPANGEVVFKKVCGQCHKLYGEGAEVGPDITRNGRNNWEQLLWNVIDPSQVIGPGYQARILITADGRTLTGLPVEESDQRVVLKVQGGKQEAIPREQIEVYKVSELSMMPDQLEKQVTPQELADLLSYLAHDRHPRDPEAKLLPGAPAPRRTPQPAGRP